MMALLEGRVSRPSMVGVVIPCIALTWELYLGFGDHLLHQVLAFFNYFILQEVEDLISHGPRSYFSSGWNVLDLLMIIISICVFIITLVQFKKTPCLATLSAFEGQQPEVVSYTDWLPFLDQYKRKNLTIAMLIFSAWLKWFKYLSWVDECKVVL